MSFHHHHQHYSLPTTSLTWSLVIYRRARLLRDMRYLSGSVSAWLTGEISTETRAAFLPEWRVPHKGKTNQRNIEKSAELQTFSKLRHWPQGRLFCDLAIEFGMMSEQRRRQFIARMTCGSSWEWLEALLETQFSHPPGDSQLCRACTVHNANPVWQASRQLRSISPQQLNPCPLPNSSVTNIEGGPVHTDRPHHWQPCQNLAA